MLVAAESSMYDAFTENCADVAEISTLEEKKRCSEPLDISNTSVPRGEVGLCWMTVVRCGMTSLLRRPGVSTKGWSIILGTRDVKLGCN